MGVKRINPPKVAKPIQDLYAQVVVANKFAFVAGQVAIDAEGALVGRGEHGAQARQAFANLRAAIEGAGAKPENIVRMTIYVAQHRDDLVPVIFAAGHEAFGAWPIASSVLIGVQALGFADWLIEVDAIVAL
jgi:enamine deaminase RidA (YjgF/YER057c/UK114 family)